jgi:cell division protein FtsI (penicillin-binding protein 3)
LNLLAQQTADTSSRCIPFVEQHIKEGTVPKVKGMGLVDAIFAMENAGFKTNVFGKGKVISQSLLPGEKLKLGTQVAIELN